MPSIREICTSDDTNSLLLSRPSRLTAVRATGLLDGEGSDVLDRLSALVTRLLDVEMAIVTLVDEEGQSFPGMSGLSGWPAAARRTALAYSFCQHVVISDAPLVIADTAESPLVRDSPGRHEFGVRAYAGVPLRTTCGETLGALCAVSTTPRAWTHDEVTILQDMAAFAIAELELRNTKRELLSAREQIRKLYGARGRPVHEHRRGHLDIG